jgi:hypothetical protein
LLRDGLELLVCGGEFGGKGRLLLCDEGILRGDTGVKTGLLGRVLLLREGDCTVDRGVPKVAERRAERLAEATGVLKVADDVGEVGVKRVVECAGVEGERAVRVGCNAKLREAVDTSAG